MGWTGHDTAMIGVFLDDPREVPEDELRSFACISKPDAFEGHEGFENIDIGGGQFLIGNYIGPYDGLVGAWQETMAEAGKHDVRDADPCFERYLVHDDANPEKCITEIYIPIA